MTKKLTHSSQQRSSVTQRLGLMAIWPEESPVKKVWSFSEPFGAEQ